MPISNDLNLKLVSRKGHFEAHDKFCGIVFRSESNLEHEEERMRMVILEVNSFPKLTKAMADLLSEVDSYLGYTSDPEMQYVADAARKVLHNAQKQMKEFKHD